MRSHLPCELLKSAMSDLERDVTALASGWTDELRARSRALYSHMVRHWSKTDESVLQQRFLEPHATPEAFFSLRAIRSVYMHTRRLMSTSANAVNMDNTSGVTEIAMYTFPTRKEKTKKANKNLNDQLLLNLTKVVVDLCCV